MLIITVLWRKKCIIFGQLGGKLLTFINAIMKAYNALRENSGFIIGSKKEKCEHELLVN